MDAAYESPSWRARILGLRCRDAARILVVGAVVAAPVQATSIDNAAPADNPNGTWLPLGLQSYEPSAFGYTKNSNDVHFFDFKLSVQYPLIPEYSLRWWGPRNTVYFSFTGMWGFYIGDRYSSPVVAKEYNPQLFWKHLWSNPRFCKDGGYRPGPSYPNNRSATAESADSSGTTSLNCYVTVGYNHESNGQIIDSPGQYLETANSQGTGAANDAISRGWDYLGVTGKFIPYWGTDGRLTVYSLLKYFLNDGLLQGKPEELHYWESPPDGKPRKEVDGLSVLAKYQRKLFGHDSKLALGYTTGYQDAFRYSTLRVEAGIKVFGGLPIVLWTQRGYMSDLAQYYRNVTGYGVQVEIGAF